MTSPGPQHRARARRAAGLRAGFGIVGLAVLVVGATVAVTAALAAPAADRATPEGSAAESRVAPPPMVSPTPAAACDRPGVAEALQKGDDAAVVEAMGGAEAMREAVAAGAAPCIDLSDPARVWVVVDKARPFVPVSYRPASLGPVSGVRNLGGGWLRADAGAAMTALVAAAKAAGAGELAIESSFRSYQTQVTSYGNQVAAKGRAAADQASARPGYSEHQSGLAADLVACSSGRCSGLDALASTPQGAWLAAHAWEYGWIVRYEAGQTPVTGYAPEPWHIRYIGVALATAYHDGGFHALETFWGLPAAPAYPD